MSRRNRGNVAGLLHFDTDAIDALSVEIPKVGYKGAKSVHAVLVEGGNDLRDTWRRNAEQTAGKHGRLYPKSIESNVVISRDFLVEVGPNPNKPQGGMSFEYGSSKQPAHLDGQLAAGDVVPRIEKRIEMVLYGSFGLGQ